MLRDVYVSINMVINVDSGAVLKNKIQIYVFHVGSVYRRGVFMKPISCCIPTRENDDGT